MIIEREYPDLTLWANLRPLLGSWFETLLILSLLGLVVALGREFIHQLRERGGGSLWRTLTAIPFAALESLLSTTRSMAIGLIEVLSLPLGLRRVWAIARLSIKEAIRQRVLYVLVLFLIPFLFAGWYLTKSEEVQLLYLVGFTNTAMSWLLLPMVLFVVGMSIPNDIKNRTIQTVVTKPVRRIELVLGRVLGFMLVFTLVIAFMGGVSYAFIRSQISDRVLASQWMARVPVYASVPDPELSPFFFIKKGAASLEGTNVGREWGYRSHIEGDTSDAVRWYFHFDPTTFKGMDKVKVGMTFDVFKTTKGNPTRAEDEGSGVWCSLDVVDLVDPRNKFDEALRIENNRLTELEIPASVLSSGKVVVQAQCLTRNQFLGMAKHDLYLQAREQSFATNFMKGLVSLWLKVLFLTSVAAAASTVLNGFVTVVFTVGVYFMGLFHDFLMTVASGQNLGGGPVESMIRLVLQKNQTIDLDPGFMTSLAKTVDPYLLHIMGAVGAVIPNLSTVETSEYVASGFDIPTWLLVRNALVVVGYVVPFLVAGCFLFRARETSA